MYIDFINHIIKHIYYMYIYTCPCCMLNASDLRHLGDALTELDRRGETFFGSKMMAMSIFCAFLYEVIQIV